VKNIGNGYEKMSSDGGKGSGRRPQVVSDDVVADNWARIFAKNPDNTGISVSDYHENIDSEQDKVTRYNTETQEVKQ
jgi:hypothetical protein